MACAFSLRTPPLGLTNQQSEGGISLTTDASFWELFIGSLTLIRYQGWIILVHTIFPLAGLFLISTPLLGYRLGPVEVLLALLAFSFTPLVTALAVWAMQRGNALAQGTIAYSFDAEGLHTSSPTFTQTIKWAAIPRVRRTRRFLFVFLTPIRAVCIPLRLVSPQDLEKLCTWAKEHTSFS